MSGHDKAVVARAARQRIGAGTAGQAVITGSAGQAVAQRAAGQPVVASPTIDHHRAKGRRCAVELVVEPGQAKPLDLIKTGGAACQGDGPDLIPAQHHPDRRTQQPKVQHIAKGFADSATLHRGSLRAVLQLKQIILRPAA